MKKLILLICLASSSSFAEDEIIDIWTTIDNSTRQNYVSPRDLGDLSDKIGQYLEGQLSEFQRENAVWPIHVSIIGIDSSDKDLLSQISASNQIENVRISVTIEKERSAIIEEIQKLFPEVSINQI